MSATSTVSRPSTVRPASRPVARTPAPAPGRPGPVRHARAARPVGCPSSRTPAARHGRERPPSVPLVAPVRSTHLTARGRLAAVLMLALLLLAAFSLGRTVAEGSTAAAAPPRLEEVVVQPGDTLWAVAQRIAPGQDPRPVVDQIRRLNQLPSAQLQAGQQLLLPAAP